MAAENDMGRTSGVVPWRRQIPCKDKLPCYANFSPIIGLGSSMCYLVKFPNLLEAPENPQ
eukprot:4085135-Amphidinium_carterae.1